MGCRSARQRPRRKEMPCRDRPCSTRSGIATSSPISATATRCCTSTAISCMICGGRGSSRMIKSAGQHGAQSRSHLRHLRPRHLDRARPQPRHAEALRRNAAVRHCASEAKRCGHQAVRPRPARPGHRARRRARARASRCPAPRWSAATATPAPTARWARSPSGIGSSEVDACAGHADPACSSKPKTHARHASKARSRRGVTRQGPDPRT